MVYTEIKEIEGRRYYYRVKSVKKDGKVGKERRYLGVDLDKKDLSKAEIEADKELVVLKNILSKEELKRLERIKGEYAKEPKENLENRYESFCSLFTHDSTAIEGNTLTLQETASLLFENRTPKGKSLREINETLNHRKAFDYITSYKDDLNKKFILELHKLVVIGTLRDEIKEQIGRYREVQVYIRGTKWFPPKPEEVPKEIATLLRWYSNNKNKLHPLVLAAYFHVAFETIHPFVDGNGRVGRLLTNFILRRKGYPMINIPKEVKDDYYKFIEEARTSGNLSNLVKFLMKLLEDNKIRF